MRLRVRSLTLLSGLTIRVAVSCGVGHRRGSDTALLWFWHRLVATAPIRPLPWEPPYAMSVTLKKRKNKIKKTNNKEKTICHKVPTNQRKAKDTDSLFFWFVCFLFLFLFFFGHLSSLGKCLFRSPDHFLSGFFFLF